MRDILVTGATGFIGFHLCKRLVEQGDKVIGMDNLNDYYHLRGMGEKPSPLGEGF